MGWQTYKSISVAIFVKEGEKTINPQGFMLLVLLLLSALLPLATANNQTSEQIYEKTYSPYVNQYQTDGNSQFTLEYDMTSEADSGVREVTLAPVDSDFTSPSGDYRWMDVADQAYSDGFQESYNYTQANVHVSYNVAGELLLGEFTGQNLKPNFAYQLKIVGTPGVDGNELIGLAGRWWEQVWTGTSWSGGANLNNKGNGSSPNPNDLTYFARRDVEDGDSDTGFHYKYTGYLVFAYFITDSNGGASFSFETGSSYHVLWKTDQRTHTLDDGSLETATFDPTGLEPAYDVDYGNQTISIFGEWERRPMGSVNLTIGTYDCQMVLTEESFHETEPLSGNWAAAMTGIVSFDIVPEGIGEMQEELAYDDGIRDGGYNWPWIGDICAVRFTPSISGLLRRCAFYAYAEPTAVKIHIMDSGGTDVISPFICDVTDWWWINVNLLPYEVEVSAGVDFYIGLEWTVDEKPWLGVDTSSPSGRSWVLPYGGAWFQYPYDFMIRATVGSEGEADIEVNPAHLDFDNGDSGIASQGGSEVFSLGETPEVRSIMRFDDTMLQEWVKSYNIAPLACVDSESIPETASFSLLDHLEYDPSERNQLYCGNCWVWAGTGVMEVALDVQEGVKDRLSVQYFNSWWHGGIPYDWACCGGTLTKFASWYQNNMFAIPWSNTNAYWQDAYQQKADGTSISGSTISISPNYALTSCVAETVETHDVGQPQAINNIKSVLGQNKAIYFSFSLPNNNDWNLFFDFWDEAAESSVWSFDYSDGHTWNANQGGGHAVLCVGYDDTDPENSYWIMVNSWGTTADRPNGIFRLDMDMNYDCLLNGFGYNLGWQTLDVDFDLKSQPVIVYNVGDDFLEVSSIECDQPWLSVFQPCPPSFGIAPGERQTVLACAEKSGLVAGTYYGNMDVYSNDPDENPLTVTVTMNVEPANLAVPLDGWVVDPGLTNAPYVLSSTESALSVELDAEDTGSKVAIYSVDAPQLSLGDYACVNVSVTGTGNARVLLRFFLDSGSIFDVVYWASPGVLDAKLFDLTPYAGSSLTGLVYVALMSSDGYTASIDISEVVFEVPSPPSPLVPLSGWLVDSGLTNAPYVLSSTESSLSLELEASSTSSKVAVYCVGVSKLSLTDYGCVDISITGSSNAKVLLRFFTDDGSSFDVAYWMNPTVLDAVSIDLSPYSERTLSGLVYVALMSSDGSTASIDITRIAFETPSPLVPLSGWLVNPSLTNAPYTLTSSVSSLSLELEAENTGSKVAIFSIGVSKLSLSDYGCVSVVATGTENARILLRFFTSDGSSFDVAYWQDPTALDVITFDLRQCAGKTLSGLVYVALMSSDGETANLDITEIAFEIGVLPPEVPLSGWLVDSGLTNADYVLSSTESSLSVELDALDTSSKVAVYSFSAPKLVLGDYDFVDVEVAGSGNALVLVRFFLDDGSSFDVVESQIDGHPVWMNPADLNDLEFSLSLYAARTLTGLVYVALMSSDGSTANITITEIAFADA